jgi:hypothetical protein
MLKKISMLVICCSILLPAYAKENKGFFKPFTIQTPFEQSRVVSASVMLSRLVGSRPDLNATASFVSENGLILTNYHIAATMISSHSRYIETGFQAEDIHSGLPVSGFFIKVPQLEKKNGQTILSGYKDVYRPIYLISFPPERDYNITDEELDNTTIKRAKDYVLLWVDYKPESYLEIDLSPIKTGEEAWLMGYPCMTLRTKEGVESFFEKWNADLPKIKQDYEYFLKLKKSLSKMSKDEKLSLYKSLREYYRVSVGMVHSSSVASAYKMMGGASKIPVSEELAAENLEKEFVIIEQQFVRYGLKGLERYKVSLGDIDKLPSQKDLGYPDADGSLRFSCGVIKDISTLTCEGFAEELKEKFIDKKEATESLFEKFINALRSLGDSYFIIDADCTDGNSGSPVLNSHGKLIGIYNAGLPKSAKGDKGNNGLFFPINKVWKDLRMELYIRE